MAMAETTGSVGRRATLKVTLVKSTIGFNRKQAEVVRGLGLRRIRHTVEVLDTPEMRGMVRKVRHLVTVDEG
jgi:large subunit ribosomal protein L30